MISVDRKQQLIIIIIAAVVIFSAGYNIGFWKKQPEKNATDIVSQEYNNRQIKVHVSGAVEKPGVYKITFGSRIQDVLEKAVSLPEADIQGLNLAAPLKDGQKLVVPEKQAVLGVPTQSDKTDTKIGNSQKVISSEANRQSDKLNINRANAAELEDLPGLGPALAQRIIDYRETQGMFTSEEDIKSVKGIGDKIFEKIKDKITVS